MSTRIGRGLTRRLLAAGGRLSGADITDSLPWAGIIAGVGFLFVELAGIDMRRAERVPMLSVGTSRRHDASEDRRGF
jgi:hypothetical protein